MNAVRMHNDSFSVHCFPEDDRVFCEHVEETLEANQTSEVTEARTVLIERLRDVYPRCEVRVRDPLAGFANAALYVFRDGKAVSAPESDGWLAEPATARLVTNADGIYVDANDAAVDLFGVDRHEIVGQRAGAFTEPDAAVKDGAELWRSLAETGRLHSLAVISGPGGTAVRVEFITVKDVDGPDRHVTYMRRIERVDRPT